MLIFGLLCFLMGSYIGIGGWLAAHLTQTLDEPKQKGNLVLHETIATLTIIIAWPIIVRTTE